MVQTATTTETSKEITPEKWAQWANRQIEIDAKDAAAREIAEEERKQVEAERTLEHDTESLNCWLKQNRINATVTEPCIRFNEFELRLTHYWGSFSLQVFAPAPYAYDEDDGGYCVGDMAPSSTPRIGSASQLAAWMANPVAEFQPPYVPNSTPPASALPVYISQCFDNLPEVVDWMNTNAANGYCLKHLSGNTRYLEGSGDGFNVLMQLAN